MRDLENEEMWRGEENGRGEDDGEGRERAQTDRDGMVHYPSHLTSTDLISSERAHRQNRSTTIAACFHSPLSSSSRREVTAAGRSTALK